MSTPSSTPAPLQLRRPVLVLPDAEVLLRAWLKDALAAHAAHGSPPTSQHAAVHGVGVAVPKDWKPRDPRGSYVAVASDGTPEVAYRGLLATTAVRASCWAKDPTTAKGLAALVLGLLLAHPGGGGIRAVSPGTGVLPATDPDSGADLASITVRVRLRPRSI